MTKPLVSVIIPAYNHEAYVSDTLESIASQTYPNIQLIIIDDGSSDNTAKIIEKFLTKRGALFTSHFYASHPNKGLSKTLNEGLDHAIGKYIYLIASDDIAVNTAISKLVRTMEANPELGMACGDASFINKIGQPQTRKAGGNKYSTFLRYFTRNRRHYSIPFDLHSDFGSYESLLGGNYIPIGPLIRKSVYEEIGTYDTDLVYEDYNQWVKLAKHYKFKLVDDILAHYRAHDTNLNLVLRNKICTDRIKIHIREKEYSLTHGYSRAWSIKYVELTLGLITRRQWADFKSLASQGEPRLLLIGSALFLMMLIRKALRSVPMYKKH